MSDLLHAVPVSPRDGELVAGNAVFLEWESQGATDTHHVQISDRETFDRPIVDAVVGTAHSLQLLGVLPQDGRTLWWRVASHKGAWSAAVSFRSGSRRPAAPARPAAIAAKKAAAAAARTLPSGEPLPLYLQGTTGQGELAGAIAVLVALVLFLVSVLAF